MTVDYYRSCAHSPDTDTYSLASISVNSSTTTTDSTDSSMAIVPSSSPSLDGAFSLHGGGHHHVPTLQRQPSDYSNASTDNGAVSLGCSSSTSCGGSSMCCSSCDSEQSAIDVFSPSEAHLFPPLPLSEDEDEDWREFGYLLENWGDELPLFTDDEIKDDILNKKSKHHYCHHHQNLENSDSNGNASAPSPPLPESLVDINNNDSHMSVDEQCDASSLSVEAPSLAAESVALAADKESAGKNDSLSTDLLELHDKQCVDNQCWWWPRFFHASNSDSAKNSDTLMKLPEEDEPVAKRTRNGLIFKSCHDEEETAQQSGAVALNLESTNAASVPSTSNRIVAVAPRPWWFHKLNSMRQQQSTTNRRRKRKRSTVSSKRQNCDSTQTRRLVPQNRRRNGKGIQKIFFCASIVCLSIMRWKAELSSQKKLFKKLLKFCIAAERESGIYYIKKAD